MNHPHLARVLAAMLTVACWATGAGVAQAAPPANDNFASAQVVGPALPVAVPGTNVDATAEAGEPAVAGNAAISTVWYRWTAPAGGTTVIDLCNDGFSGPEDSFRAVEVYSGPTLGTIVSVAEGESLNCHVRFNATPGSEYRFQLDYRDTPGNFTFRLRQLAPPVNDSFANATDVGPALPVTVPASNVDATWQASEPPVLGNSGSSRSVWFRWTAPSNGQVRVSACDFETVSGAGNLAIAIYTGATLPSLVAVAAGSNACEQTFTAMGGTVYRIAFSGTIRGEGEFTLRIKSAPPPPNDAFANAESVGPTLGLTAFGNNEFATAEAGEPDHTGNGFPAARSVWFSWTPAADRRVAVAACTREFGARVAVYTGNAVNALTDVAEKPPFAPHCRVLLNAVAGTTYFIAVGGGPQDGVYGEFALRIRAEKRPGNDDFARSKRLIIKSSGTVNGTTRDATSEVTEDAHDPDGTSSGSGSVWFRWTAQRSRPVVLSACSSVEPVAIAVYTGNALGALDQKASSATGCKSGKGGRLTIAQVKGTTYRIAVAALNRDFPGAFALSSRIKTRKFSLQKRLRTCGKIRSAAKRKRCRTSARQKTAVLKCQKKLDAAKQTKCEKAARKRF